MSSIAYVTDNKMIEYHRLNGNRSFNFWRISSSIRFSDFNEGDLLFFLAKGTEKKTAKGKEKGLIGYGVYEKSEVLPPSVAWKRYTLKNGYSTKEEFFDALIKVSKEKELPKTISSLHLRDVVFFQAPIYLSEIGIEISNNVESYTYIDKDNYSATLQILEKAKEVGIDIWSLTFDDYNEPEVFDNAQSNEVLSKISSFLKTKFPDKIEKKMKQMALQYVNENNGQDIDYVKGSDYELVQYKENVIHIYMPFVLSAKEKSQYLQMMIGKVLAFQSLVLIDPYTDNECALHAIVEESIEEGFEMLLENVGINVEKI